MSKTNKKPKARKPRVIWVAAINGTVLWAYDKKAKAIKDMGEFYNFELIKCIELVKQARSKKRNTTKNGNKLLSP